jgi:hypothetical protein
MAGSIFSQGSKTAMNDEEAVCAILGRKYISKPELCAIMLKFHRQIMGLLVELYCVDRKNSHFTGANPEMLKLIEVEADKKYKSMKALKRALLAILCKV